MVLKCSKGFWNNQGNQEEYLERVSYILELKTPEMWYRVMTNDIIARGGKPLLQKYGTMYKVLTSLYSGSFSVWFELSTSLFTEYDWQPWKFETVPRNIWKDIGITRDYLKWVARILDIKNLDDWYGVTDEHLAAFHGNVFLLHYGTHTYCAI